MKIKARGRGQEIRKLITYRRKNRIGGVMVIVLALSAVDHIFEPWSD
jgi:hypothetical protein